MIRKVTSKLPIAIKTALKALCVVLMLASFAHAETVSIKISGTIKEEITDGTYKKVIPVHDLSNLKIDPKEVEQLPLDIKRLIKEKHPEWFN